MIIGAVKLTLHILESQNLKNKRRIVKSICERVRARFNVTIAEIGEQNKWQVAILGYACIDSDSHHLQQSIRKITDFINDMQGNFIIANQQNEIITIL